MISNQIRETEKFLKRNSKNKLSITLATVIVFLMTGCGSGGGEQ